MKQVWSKQDLEENWTLSSQEKDLIGQKQNIYKLIFAIRLKFFEQFGYPLEQIDEVPDVVKRYLAKQLNSNLKIPDHYFNSRAYREHTTAIRKFFNFRNMGEKELQKLKEWLWKFKFPLGLPYMQLNVATYKYLYDLHIEPRSAIQMERYLRSWTYQFEEEFFEKAGKTLNEADKEVLDSLLRETKDKDEIALSELKKDPRKASVKAIEIEIRRLELIKKTNILTADFFQKLSPNLLRKYHDYVAALAPSDLIRYGKKNPQKRYALLACFCYVRGIKFTDNLTQVGTEWCKKGTK